MVALWGSLHIGPALAGPMQPAPAGDAAQEKLRAARDAGASRGTAGREDACVHVIGGTLVLNTCGSRSVGAYTIPADYIAPDGVPGPLPDTRKEVTVNTGSVISKATEFLHAAVQEIERPARIVVTPLSGANLLRVGPGRVAVAYRADIAKTINRRICVWADIQVDDRHYRSVPLWYRVELYKNALVAIRNVTPGEGLDGDAFEVRETDVSGIGDAFDRLPRAIDGYRARRLIQAGQVLRRSSIEPIPAVVAGARVEVRTGHGTVSLQTYGIAQSSGGVGDVVTIRNPASNRTFQAVVAGSDRVEVSQR